MQLNANTRLAKWFVWSCDHLIFTVGHTYPENGPPVARTGAYYLANGTTLCHVFWAILWWPLLITGWATLMLILFFSSHIEAHNSYGYKYGVAAYFIPEAVLVGIVAAVAIIILALIGGEKTGFFKMLWQYLKGFKSHICPLVRFNAPFSTPAE